MVRPTVTFGPGDILVNNLAWTLRRLPVFGIPGDGRYPIQPVHIDDIADLAVRAGSMIEDVVMDAAGPDIFTFNELLALVGAAVGSRARMVHLPAGVALAAAWALGLLVRDVVLTRDEVTELRARLMVSALPPAGRSPRELGSNMGHRRTAGSQSAWTDGRPSTPTVDNIREVMAFPKTQSGSDLMMGVPSPIAPHQLEEVHLSIVEE